MSQHDYNIANQSFPSFRSDLNNALSAIQTTNSGTSLPTGAVAGQIWLDTTNATSPTLKFYDGTDSISLATINYTANTVDWLDSSVTITGLSTTATGTVLTLTDTAHTTSVNMILGNNTALRFNELTANGSNYIGLKAPASVTADLTFTLPVAPTSNNQALISTTAGVMAFTPYTFPTSDGTASQVLQTNGSGVLSFATASGGKVLQVVGATDGTQRSTSSNSFVTGSNTLSVSITPASASNKIFVITTGQMQTPAGSYASFFTLKRDSTNLGDGTYGMGSFNSADYFYNGSFAFSYLDSPSSTSALTYQLYLRSQTGGSATYLNVGGSVSSITAFEIKG